MTPQRIEEMRREFDERFARTRPPPTPEHDKLLLIETAGERWALPLAGLAGLQSLRRIVPLPGARPELLGLSAVRGRLVPVFSLARLLGRPEDPAPRWFALAGDEDPLGFAFAEMTGQRQAVLDTLAAPAGEQRSPVRRWVALDEGRIPLLHLPDLTTAARAGATLLPKEA